MVLFFLIILHCLIRLYIIMTKLSQRKCLVSLQVRWNVEDIHQTCLWDVSVKAMKTAFCASSLQKWHQTSNATVRLYGQTLCCAAPPSSPQPGSCWATKIATWRRREKSHLPNYRYTWTCTSALHLSENKVPKHTATCCHWASQEVLPSSLNFSRQTDTLKQFPFVGC